MDDDRTSGEQTRAVLRNVAAYRDLCRYVRKKANGGLLFGGFMLAIWYYAIPDPEKFRPFGLIYLGLATLEFTAALWNKVRPSAEGVLIDGLVLLAFGAANLVRQYLRWQAFGRPDTFMLLIAVYWIWQGVSHIRSYASLRRAFAVRPTAEHLRWFDDLIREVRSADPSADDAALDLPTRPPLRGKLLGDTALLLPPGGEVIIVPRAVVRIERLPAGDPTAASTGHLSVGGENFGTFALDPDNWRNYVRWKAEAGHDPPVVGQNRPADADLI